MIRAGLSSSLRSLAVRQLGPSSSTSSSSPLVALRSFSSSSISRQDGLFPSLPKQDLYDGQAVLKQAGVGSIAGPEKQSAVPAPSHLSLPEGELDSTTPPLSADSPSSTDRTANSTTTPTPPSNVAAESTSTSPASSSSLGHESFYPPSSAIVPSLEPSDSQSSSSSRPAFEFTPSIPPREQTADQLAMAEAQARLSEARRDLPSAVTEAEWKYLKGPPSEIKVIRFSLVSSKNNTIGTLSWAYRPDNKQNPEKWNKTLSGTSQFSGGRLGFKGAASGGAEAAHQVAVAMFRRVEEENKKELEEKAKRDAEMGISQTGYLRDPVGVHVRLNLHGFGQGRTAFLKALKSEEGSLVRQLSIAISDHTPIKLIGGRPPGPRRV